MFLFICRYEVRTSASKFTDYLKDANPLKVEVIDVNDQVVGSTLVQNLEQVDFDLELISIMKEAYGKKKYLLKIG
jgi:hypothetical protein